MKKIRSNSPAHRSALRAAAVVAVLTSPAGFLAFGGTAAAAAPSPRAVAAETGENNDTRADLHGLLKIEDATEAIAEGEKSGSAALAAGREAVAAWPVVRATLHQNGAPSGDLSNVDRAIGALRNDLRSNADLVRDANEVTGALAPLFQRAGDKVPADVHYLDYLGRSIKLDAQSGDWTRAQSESGTLASRWNGIRSLVAARHGGSAAAAQFDRAAEAIKAAVDQHSAPATLAAAKTSGNAVDVLESVF